MVDAFLKKVIGRLHHDGHRLVRFGRAMGDPKRGLMEHRIGPLDKFVHQRVVAYIALDQRHQAALHRGFKVFRPAAHHVVDDDDFTAPFLHQEVGDMGPDKAASPGDQHALVAQSVA